MVPPMSGYDALEFPFDSYEEACEIAQGKMAEAGYPNGIGFPKITLLYNSNESNKKVAELLQANYKTILGITCVLENQEWGTFLQNRAQGSFQLARSGWVGDYQDPNTFMDMFLTGAAMNGGQFNNSEYDSLIKKASTMPAGPDRFEVLYQAENILVNEEQAIIPFYFYSSTSLVDTEKWGGWYSNTMDYHPIKSIYLKK
jgi:oligopeptide transport system substrate-binding protein